MAKQKGKDVLDTFEEQCNQNMGMGVAILLWKNRHANPELSVQVNAYDIEGLNACIDYLKVKGAKVVVERPQGRPAQAHVPAQGNRREIPARDAEPPRPFVVIKLVDENGDYFRPIERDEDNAKLQDRATEIQMLKVRAPNVAANLLAEMQTGMVDSTQRDAADMLAKMAKYLP